MARPRMFDEEHALEAAMHVFWANGYEATSTQDLCDATGLGRSSIYNTFSSKHDLFRRALIRYIESTNAVQLEILTNEQMPASDRIRALFARTVDSEFDNRPDGHSVGCLTVNTTVELAGRNPETARLLEHDLTHRLSVLRGVLEAGQYAGDITAKRDAADLARFVNATVGGIRVSSQGGADRAALESIVETAMDALTG